MFSRSKNIKIGIKLNEKKKNVENMELFQNDFTNINFILITMRSD